MKLNSVNSKEGPTWIRQGLWLFKQNPLGFLMLVFMYVFAVQLLVIIPVIGVLAILLLTPTLSVGFMTACRGAIQKEPIRPTVYLVALRGDPLIRRRILQLGLIYTLLIFILSFILSLIVDIELLMPIVTGDKPISSEAMSQVYWVLIAGGLLYVPVAMLMWFSPVLIAWENMSVSQALFSSWLACWINRGAFCWYLLIWGALLIALPLLLGVIFSALDLGQVASFIIAPYSMLGLTVMYCSFFASWKSCFANSEIATAT
jgi:hypothetical protein